MKRGVLLSGAVALMVASCGGQAAVPGGSVGKEPRPASEGAAPVTAGDGETYVFNTHGDERGRADQRPDSYVATEFTTFSAMEWEQWSVDTARGQGGASGTWCLHEGCTDDPYEVDVVLADPVEVEGTAYFSTYTVSGGGMPEDMRRAMAEADGGRLALPPG
ncbi:hypothetical protein [Nocardiopsis sp. CNT312]|uniref:hypothetical protein n=1 Tax=Nocardiopsis sp. CNT312 TaxID=1137268 RepID=UPI000491DEBE|nr:hypothetical protein [Nocardiopsis sp. CNT312]